MSEPTAPRRQPPSPLVFSPETVLPSIPSHTNTGSGSNHGSGSNTVSMPFVRRHVTRRLKAAKAECDKELQRVTNNITAFFEERLREGDHEREADREDRERTRDRGRDNETHGGDVDPLREPFVFQASELRSALQADDASSEGGYEAELETTHHSRQPSNASSLSPSSLRRQNTLPWDHKLPAKDGSPSAVSSSSTISSPAISSSPVPAALQQAEAVSPRKQLAGAASSSWGSQSMSSRRLSRTIHIPQRPTRSGQSSRSTSRSRSPLPFAPHSSYYDSAGGPSSLTSSTNRRSSRIIVDDPIDPIMSALYDIIGVATDVIDMSIAQLTVQPKFCEQIVQRVQTIGRAWDEHPDWHGRNWYVQVLLAVASLSRVVEWWEAEKSFWNFDDNDDEQDEPLTFVTKPADVVQPTPTPAPTPTAKEAPTDLSSLAPTADDENRLRLSRPTSQGRRSRDAMTKDLSMTSHGTASSTSQASPSVVKAEQNESARVLATERLRLQAETAQNQNIVMELSLDGDHFIWINYAWRVVVGSDPEALAGTRISRLLSPSDWGVFRDATRRLQQDDSHTVEVSFKLRVEPEDGREASSGTLYQQMEGKGMLMIDREDGQPSHTMWVVKPIAPPRYEQSSPSIMQDSAENPLAHAQPAQITRTSGRELVEPVTPFPFSQPISVEPVLCRICECQIPQWYFEKHSETCVEVHRLEAEIGECNETISELRSTVRELATAMDRSSPVTVVPEYRGMPIFSPSTSPSTHSPLQLFRSNKMQRMSVKKMQRLLMDQLEDILQVASEIAIPALKDEESKEPIERQRLLSPGSERKMSQVRSWQRPKTEDSALGQLVNDAERVMRSKVDNVVRMQNTIRYAEKIWHEWEERVEQHLAAMDDAEDRGEDEEGSQEGVDSQESKSASDDEDHSSTTSEYAFSGDVPSSEPTPMASSSPAQPGGTPPSGGTPPIETRPGPTAPIPVWAPSTGTWQVQSTHHTRSSTPSSISSPLALAAPIVAPSSLDEHPPPMNLDESSGNLTVRTRKSASNLLEPKVTVTPPLSPMVSPRDRDSSLVRKGHRRHSTINPLMSSTSGSTSQPLSPRQPSANPLSRSSPTSIKDFDVIKPISKGAFGSVFLAKKKATGDYFAIKVLKKADMIAKNQITNVKAERMILMKQAESPFVAKLFFTFQSKDNLYLVMEYLNGGDCAALIKSLGSLPEEWTKNYIAEVVLGLEYLHERGVVHRDLKPDNLLIDQHGHLKLTDFGLSRIGLLGRQTRDVSLVLRPQGQRSRSRPPSLDAAYLTSPLQSAIDVAAGDDASESGSESLLGFLGRKNAPRPVESPLQSFASDLANDLRSHSSSHSGSTPPADQKFVGTPDYLAPETILGLRGDDAAVDWWALGVITYEFLYGIPPFHAESPEKVFENILSGHIEWHEDWIEFSDEARDFMQRLMTIDPAKRLGANGAGEVKAHPFFQGIEWDKVTSTEAAFIPQVTDPESTDYFDPRGAIPQLFQDDEMVAIASNPPVESPGVPSPAIPSATLPVPIQQQKGDASPADDFGSFSFKNLPVLKQANDDMIRKIRTDQMAPIAHTLSEPSSLHHRRRSVSQRHKKPPSVQTTAETKPSTTNPPSPATSTSSIASSPSRSSVAPSTPGSAAAHSRKPSEYGAVERFKLSHLEGGVGVDRRNSMPSRLRTASVSSAGDGSGSENWPSSVGHGSTHFEATTPPSSVHSIDFKPPLEGRQVVDLKKAPDPSDRAVTCLLAEDNPITAKIIETLLIRLGCRCVVVSDGSEAISVAMGDIKFDCILMDLQMPVLDGEGAARYIKSTNGRNASTPIIAVSAYSGVDTEDASNVFAASLSKPLQKADLLATMRQLGFKTSTVQGPGTTKVTASRINAL